MTPPPGCVLSHTYTYLEPAHGIAHTGNRPVEQQLIESQLTLKNITLGQPNLPLYIHGVRISACRMRSLKLGYAAQWYQ